MKKNFWLNDYFENQRNLVVKQEKKCRELISKVKNCLAELNAIFANLTEFVSNEKIVRWKNENQITIEMLKKEIPQKFSRLSYFTFYKRVWEQFFLTLESLPQMLISHNEKIFSFRVIEAKQIIGNIDGNPLDNQQLRCVVADAHNQLLIAGAGTGKTTTIVGKVKYLLRKKICKPEDILILSFTNKTVDDIRKKLYANINVPILVCTFHSLGYDKILAKLEGKKAVFGDNEQNALDKFISNQLQEEIKNPNYLNLLCDYLLYNKSQSKSLDDFNNAEEYGVYVKDNPPKTISGILVKSYGEMDIANFLWQNQVAFEYEKPYKYSTASEKYRQYQPDFYLPEYDLYIEYFGVNRQGCVSDLFSEKNGKSARKNYLDSMCWKRNVHRMYHTNLVECFAYEKFDGNLLECLKQKLTAQGVVFKPFSVENVWTYIQKVHGKNCIFQGIVLLLRAMLSQAKANGYSVEDLRLKNMKTRNILEQMDNENILCLFKPIYEAYVKMLSEERYIDFSDMINRAATYVREGKYVNPYKVIIVDEYQDISKPRYNLLKALRESSDCKLFCVGDDWQSIYRFAGSDVSYILNFEKYWGPSEIGKIETTYRFAWRLNEASSRFIKKNPAQYRKNLKSSSKDNSFALGVGLWNWRLNEFPENSSVFFLGRYNDDEKLIKIFLKNLVKTKNKGEYKYLNRKDLSINFMTVHASKGLQADYVFILNNKNGRKGFPSKIDDAPVMKLFVDNPEIFPYAEERRLFYVAMTRARKKVFFIPPATDSEESCFFKEIKALYNNDLYAESWACPLCGGRLERNDGLNGSFIICNNNRLNGKKCNFVRKIGTS